MYQQVWNRLLAKPAIDLNQVPDFLRLFFSTDNQVKLINTSFFYQFNILLLLLNTKVFVS